MRFKYIASINQATEVGVVYLVFHQWDDYSYCTTFTSYYIKRGAKGLKEIGTVKIGCSTIKERVKPTSSVNGYNSYPMKELFDYDEHNNLPSDFYSLGQDVSYYKSINEIFDSDNNDYYKGMNDLAFNYNYFIELYNKYDSCLRDSLMRSLHVSNVEQFNRITKGDAELTEYEFTFKYSYDDEDSNDEEINVYVSPTSIPPSNIHVLIGRNGVGKTWLLHNIIYRLLKSNGVDIRFEKSEKYKISKRFSIESIENSFAGVIGLSFSVFDDALSIDLAQLSEATQKTIDDFNKKYKYIGLVSKNQKDGKTKTKSVDDLSDEFINALERIRDSRNKVGLYIDTCKNLAVDPMFNDNGFINLLESYCILGERDSSKIKKDFKRLSSGHMIIILSLTLLAESIFEKTIVLIDEPETHLHPPLLSTYIRTLSYLLIKKNAVAIIATHSPIVLQEVPKSCVKRIERNGDEMRFYDINIETFATNTDSLTREVFGLEVIKTGFYQLIERELESNFDKSIKKFDGKVGFLGQVLIQSLISKKRDTNESD